MTTTVGSTGRRSGDVALAMAAAVLMVLGTSGVSAGDHPPDPLGWLLLVTAAAILAFRRLWPTAVMWATIATGFIYDAFGNPGALYTVAIGLGIYSVAAAGRRWTAVTGVLVAFGVFFAADLVAETGHMITGEGALWFAGWMTAAVLLGEVSRGRSEYLAAVELRAVEAERTREEEARRRASEERMRIARELHDVLAHSISIINVQAGAALHHLDTNPDQAREALLTVRKTGKQVLRELRSSLGVLRDPATDIGAPRAPTPGIDEIDHLIAATRQAGIDVTLKRHGDLDAIPADISLVVYRIVQESLTNVTRHAGAASATVTIDHQPGELLVRVDDDGSGSLTEPSHGHGLIGMKERVTALGGHLDAGSRQEGGFRVEGLIPLSDLT
jgi:signal transduction histidine kinase